MVAYYGEKYKSIVSITEKYHLYTEKKYNWFQKKMLKLFFNIEVEDIEE